MKKSTFAILASALLAGLSCLATHAVTFTYHSINNGWPLSTIEISPQAYTDRQGSALDILGFEFVSPWGSTLASQDPNVTWVLNNDFDVSPDGSYLMNLSMSVANASLGQTFTVSYQPNPPPWADQSINGPWRHITYSIGSTGNGGTAGRWDVPESAATLSLLLIGVGGSLGMGVVRRQKRESLS